jgi:hypothetical protein
LGGEIVFAQGFAKMIEYLKWFSFCMKSFASATLKTVKSIWCLDVVTLIFLGNRGESNDFPRFHTENVTDEVVLMQTLHHDNDASIFLVVKAAVQGVIEPFITGLPLRLR